jgi:hypothetical protein
MDTYLIVYLNRQGVKDVKRVPASSRQGAITTARTMFGAVGDVSAVKVASAKRPTVSAFPLTPGQGGRAY